MAGRRSDVAAVVVTYNRKDLLVRCLGCLAAQTTPCDVVLVDNASTDGTREMVAAYEGAPDVCYFNTGANLGGAGGFQAGVELACRMGYEALWIMDDDTLPEPTALSELLAVAASKDGWGFLSSAAYWTDGSICAANRPKKTLFRHASATDYAGSVPVPVVMGSFVSMLVPSRVVREVGLPIAEYFIWTDDYEFSGRISKRHPCFFVPASRVTHAMAKNAAARLAGAEGERLSRFRVLYRNDVHCYRQHGLEGRAYLAAKFVCSIAQALLSAKGGRLEKARTVVAGYRDGMRFDPKVRMMEEQP